MEKEGEEVGMGNGEYPDEIPAGGIAEERIEERRDGGGKKEGGGGQLGVINVGLITSGETGEADDAVSKLSKDDNNETTTIR